jgi:FtsH-binding integral membrane protein
MEEQKKDDLGIGLKIVCLLIPLVGLILYFVKKKDEPNSSKQACTWALIGVGIGIVLNIIIGLLAGGAAAIMQ